MKVFFKIILAFLLSLQSALAQDLNSQKPLIVSSINPLHQIILAISGDKSNDVLIINSGFSEHDYNLKKSDAKAVHDADLIFYVSNDLEKNFAKLVRTQNKESRAFELIKISGIKLLHQKNDQNKIDPHIWLNPQNAVKIAEFVAQKISEIDPKNSAQYHKNLEKFKKEILVTEKEIRLHLSKNKTSDYIFFHDGYQYFEDYFGIKPVKIIAGGHDAELSLAEVKEIDFLVKQGAVKCIVGEKWDEKNTARKLAKNYKIRFSELDTSTAHNYTETLKMIANFCPAI